MSKTSSIDVKAILAKASEMGYDEVPENTSAIREAIITIFQRNSGKWFRPRDVRNSIPELTNKFCCDTLWNLRKAGVLVVSEKRSGYYKLA